MFDSSLDSANFWFNFFNATLVLGAFLVAIGTAGAIKTAATKERYADERIASNEAATERAKADSVIAQNETAKSNERIAELAVQADALRKGSEEARQRAAQAELELERLRQRISQRRLDEDKFARLLVGRPMAAVELRYLADNAEAFSLARQVYAALKKANWPVSQPTPTTAPKTGSVNDPLHPPVWFNGVTVFAATMPMEDNPPSTHFVDAEKSSASGTLVRALMHSESGGVVYGLQDNTLQADKIVLVVGGKP